MVSRSHTVTQVKIWLKFMSTEVLLLLEQYRLLFLKLKIVRLAEPGEFTKIAFSNNKINLLQAESIGDLISSETEIQRNQAIKMISELILLNLIPGEIVC